MSQAPEMRHPEMPHVVLVGGGFGGLEAARTLAGRNVRVTLLDRHNYHLFQPLLYQVAMAGLSPADIATPLRSILRRAKNIRVLLASARSVSLDRRSVRLDGMELFYDALILAPGTTHSYFGHDEWEPLAPGLKTLEDALEIRRRVLLAFEQAECTPDEAERRAQMTFVVVGGGPTGVELAGALAEIARHALAQDFRVLDPRQARVVLVEGGPRVLPTFPEDLSREAEEDLRRMGVEVLTGRMVTGIAPDAVTMSQDRLPARTVLWAAGVAASPLARSLDVPLDRAGRVPVEPDLSVPGHPEVFVIGDLCSFAHQGQQPLPGLAPVAIQQGRAAAGNVLRRLAGRATHPFHYVDRGTMATIGRSRAVAVLGRLHLNGLLAWLTWVFVHIFMLIGFRNRLLVMIQWVWAYLRFQPGARLITNRYVVNQHGAADKAAQRTA